MQFLSKLSDPICWEAFLAHKIGGGHLPKAEQAALEAFIAERGYLPVCEAIRQGQAFALPRKSILSKKSSDKKRTVYTYPTAENYVLKLLGYLLQRRYDGLFARNLYSFRPAHGAREAVQMLTRARKIDEKWAYKVDISNYFNSIPIDRLLPRLSRALSDAPETCTFLSALLTQPLVRDGADTVAEQKGIMAGTPISPFLANLYLADLDRFFADKNVLYARYSDDIILFADSEAERGELIAALHERLAADGLAINPAKEEFAAPGERWTYLGISYERGVIDVSPISVEKLKAKMRRKRRALARWQAKQKTTGERAAKAFVRVFREKLFENPVANELTWTHWYFPLINTDASLQEIDRYAQSCIRSLATGKHTKAAYNFRYESIRALGYEPLVHRYWAHKAAENAEKAPKNP